MILPEPFLYPATPHQRRHGPAGYKNYQDYKPWLRDEFLFRCVYCLERETWYPSRAAAFSVEHIVPQAEDISLLGEYQNLLYACNRCNSLRQDVAILDPTKVALGMHLRVEPDGMIRALSVEGQDLIDLLDLNHTPLLVRHEQFRILALIVRYPDDPEVKRLFAEAFGFPEDLPDLTRLRPPGGNSRVHGKEHCFFKLRQRQTLPEIY